MSPLDQSMNVGYSNFVKKRCMSHGSKLEVDLEEERALQCDQNPTTSNCTTVQTVNTMSDGEFGAVGLGGGHNEVGISSKDILGGSQKGKGPCEVYRRLWISTIGDQSVCLISYELMRD